MVVAVLVSLVGGAVVISSFRSREMDYAATRLVLQSVSGKVLSAAAMNLIETDKNEWDSLDEPWAEYVQGKPPETQWFTSPLPPGVRIRISIEDEYGRMWFTNKILRCDEEKGENHISEWPSEFLPYVSSSTEKRFNPNTISKEAFFLLCSRLQNVPIQFTEGTVKSPTKEANEIWERLMKSREQGIILKRADAQEFLSLFQSGSIGTSLTTGEQQLAMLLMQYLQVNSGLFRMTVEAELGRTRSTTQMVYQKYTHRILRWSTW